MESYLEILPDELLYAILLESEPEYVISMACYASRRTYNICQDDVFW